MTQETAVEVKKKIIIIIIIIITTTTTQRLSFPNVRLHGHMSNPGV